MGVANQLDAAVYQRAERLLRHNRSTLVIGGTVVPRWADGGARFWYVQTTTAGSHFVLVDPRAGRRGPVFDHDRLAAALSSASGHEVSPRALPFGAIDLTTDAVEFGAFCTRWRCRLDSYECAKVQTRPTPAPEGVVSPDGQLAVFRRGYDLWARSLVEGREWALTTDGHEDYDYGTEPDPATKLGMPSMPAAVAWSPDSTRVLVTRTDQRGVRRVHLVDSYPTEGGAPRLLTKRYPYPGDAHVAFSEFLVLDVAAGTSVRAKADPVPTPYFSPIVIGEAWWSADGSTVFYLSHSQDFRTLHLCRFDPVTGEVSTVVTEVGETRVDANQFNQGIPPIVTSLSSGEEVLWYSQRDGWGHLYRYDARSGELLGQVTSGHWAVREILHVDEQHRVVYFLACGLVAANPYRRLVCRVRLDGTEFAVVTDDGLDHVATVSANGDYFLDCASTTDTPPVVTARDWNGRVLVEVDRADITRLVAAGWTPPQPFRTIAADGHTDLYGLLYLPPDFDPTKSYPVIDHPYPGPQTNRVGVEFNDQDGLFSCPAEAMAALGFVVMAVDGRGTPGRSKDFHDVSYGRSFEAGSMIDHIATLRELASIRPWMDLNRVGIHSLSAGGYATVRAMLDHPDVYKVGVAGCGVQDWSYYSLCWGEMYDGPYDPRAYARSSNVDNAERLEGKLLLIQGGRDDNVYPYHVLRMADRLIAANKDFDMFIIPGADHFFAGYEHCLYQRTWDFLVRHLLHAQPPNYRLTPPTPQT